MTAIRSDTQPIVSFMEQLDGITRLHPELTDTDVREALHFALNRHFVWGHQYTSAVVSFGMHSAKGDKLVESAFAQSKFQAEMQMFNIISQASATVLRSTGEGMSAVVRKN